MPPVLALYEDILSNGAELALPALPRMIFIVHGGVAIADRAFTDGEAWHGEGAATLYAGSAGATCWRFELGSAVAADGAAAGATSRPKLCARLDTLPPGDLLLRGRFPAGRLRLSAPASGARHPLPARGRHPHRYSRTLDLLWAGRRLVRERTRARVRASRRRPGEPLRPRDDPAARADRKKARSNTSTPPTRRNRGCSSTRSSPTRRSRGQRDRQFDH